MVEYNISIVNPKTGNSVAKYYIPEETESIQYLSYEQREYLMTNIALGMIKDSNKVKDSDFHDIVNHVLSLKEDPTVESFGDFGRHIWRMSTDVIFVSDNVNPYTENKAENPVIKIEKITCKDNSRHFSLF